MQGASPCVLELGRRPPPPRTFARGGAGQRRMPSLYPWSKLPGLPPLRTLAGDGGHCGGRAWSDLGSSLSVGRPHRCGDASSDVGAVVGGWLVRLGPPGPVEGGDYALYRIPRPRSPLFTFVDRRPPLPAVGLPWWDCATSTLPLTWGLQRTWRQYLPVLWRERPGGESRCAPNLSNIPCSCAATTC